MKKKEIEDMVLAMGIKGELDGEEAWRILAMDPDQVYVIPDTVKVVLSKRGLAFLEKKA